MASVRAVDVNRAAAVMADSSRPLSRPPTSASHIFTPSGGRDSNPIFSYSTPSKRATRVKDDPEQLAKFFRARSAKLDSPIFQKKRFDHGCTFPEVRLGPKFRETSSVPHYFPHERILEYTFEPTSDKLGIVDLGHKVARNPLPYSILLHQREESVVYPVQVRLKPISNKCKHMFVLARPTLSKEEEEEMVQIECSAIAEGMDPPEPHQPFWEHPQFGDSTGPASKDIELKFWAAPCEEGVRGNCIMEIIIVDNNDEEHVLELPFTAIGCKPELKLSGPGLQTTETRKAMTIGNSIKVTLSDDTDTQPIYLKNESTRGCSVLAAVYLTNDGSIRNQEAPFLLWDMEESVYTKSIVKVLKPGDTIEMAVELKVPMGEGVLIPPKFLGTVNVRVAYFLNNKPKTDAELPQYFDQIIYLEAPRPDGIPLVASPNTTIQEVQGLRVNDNFPTALDFEDDERSYGSFQGPTMTDQLFADQRENDFLYDNPRTPDDVSLEDKEDSEEEDGHNRENSPDVDEPSADTEGSKHKRTEKSAIRDNDGGSSSGPDFYDPDMRRKSDESDGPVFYKGSDSSDPTTAAEEVASLLEESESDTSTNGSNRYVGNGQGEFDHTEDNCINLNQIGEMPTPFRNPRHLSPTQQETPIMFKNPIPTFPGDTPPIFESSLNADEELSEQAVYPSLEDLDDDKSGRDHGSNPVQRRARNSMGPLSGMGAGNERNDGDGEAESKSAWEHSPTDVTQPAMQMQPPEPVKLKMHSRVKKHGVLLKSNRGQVAFNFSNDRDYAITVWVESEQKMVESVEQYVKLEPRTSGKVYLRRRGEAEGGDHLRVSAYPEADSETPVGSPAVYRIPLTVEAFV